MISRIVFRNIIYSKSGEEGVNYVEFTSSPFGKAVAELCSCVDSGM